LKVAQLQPPVAKVFDLLGFQLLFEIYESKEEALRSFQSKGV
jgi:anti-anti-sigma regulatory factor